MDNKNQTHSYPLNMKGQTVVLLDYQTVQLYVRMWSVVQ